MAARRTTGRIGTSAALAAALLGGLLAFTAVPAGAVTVSTESAFRSAWSNPATTEIELLANITLTCVGGSTPIRNSATPISVDGRGHTLHNSCTTGDHGVLRSTGAGQLTVLDITISGGHAVSNNGSGINTTNADLVIVNSNIINNVGGPGGSAGGGVTGDGGGVSVYGSTFSGNTTDGGPGTAISSDTFVAIIDSVISNNPGTEEAIATDGTLSLVDSVLSNNGGTGSYAGAGSTLLHATVANNGGRGINGLGPVTITESTISGNSGRGAHSDGTMTVVSSTIHGNSERGVSGFVVNAVQSTFTGNSTSGSLSNLRALNQLNAFGSVVADPNPGGTNCELGGSATSNGFNRVTDSSCGLPGGEVTASPLQLGPLADNGGPTRTRMPSNSSPLVNAIPAGNCGDDGASAIEADQRGFTRPARATEGCDIGAVEVCLGGTFSDVPLASTFARDICWMGANEITTGSPAGSGTYKPTAAVSRQAMSAFMYRLAGEPPFSPSGQTFIDVATSSTFYKEIEWMAAEGITNGSPSGSNTYRPAQPVSRQAMSAFMYRLAGEPVFVDPATARFVDVPLGHTFFTEVEWMADEEITTGSPAGSDTFKPSAAVSRQAMSAFMRRLDAGPGVGI